MIAIRNREDAMPSLLLLAGLTVARESDPVTLGILQSKSAGVIERRFDAGHRAYVARLNGDAAAFGWVATRSAEIGEVGAEFSIPERSRYLWNFVTLPAHRGRGVYPRLLQAIIRAESSEADRFWIAYAPENQASASGIAKAGFTPLAEMSFDGDGRAAVRAIVNGGGAVASRVLGIRETGEALTPCWRCVRAGRPGMTCTAESCRCDYQAPRSGCAA